jgi:hypothetical protein
VHTLATAYVGLMAIVLGITIRAVTRLERGGRGVTAGPACYTTAIRVISGVAYRSATFVESVSVTDDGTGIIFDANICVFAVYCVFVS